MMHNYYIVNHLYGFPAQDWCKKWLQSWPKIWLLDHPGEAFEVVGAV
jgi:hypothetical protein